LITPWPLKKSGVENWSSRRSILSHVVRDAANVLDGDRL
jgi:hypothetical protein